MFWQFFCLWRALLYVLSGILVDFACCSSPAGLNLTTTRARSGFISSGAPNVGSAKPDAVERERGIGLRLRGARSCVVVVAVGHQI